MKVFGMCINLKVVAGLAVAGALVWVVAPSALVASLPLLAFLVCPLSMLLMMRSMGGARSQETSSDGADAARERVAGSQHVGGDGREDVPATPSEPAMARSGGR